MPEPCGAVPPPSIYGRGVHVEPCILDPGHGGTHLPGNQDELNRLSRARRSTSLYEPMYPGASDQGHEIRGHAIIHTTPPRKDT